MDASSNDTGKTNLLILASSLWIGGAESVIQHLAQGVDRARFNVTVCYLKERGHVGAELEKAGIDIVGINDSKKADYFTFLKLRNVIRQRRIDVVHTHTTHGLVDATICRLLIPGLKVVHTFHFGNYPHTRPRILWMERVFSRLATKLFSVGDVQQEQLRRVYALKPSAIRTIRNGVVDRPSSGDPTFRARIGAEGKLLIGTIATLIPQKGLPDLMQVARRLLDAGHPVKFVIVGEGQLRSELEGLRAQLGLDEHVALPGWITNASTEVLPTFDIFFQPSLWEAMSMVVLEAMAAGRPVVATRVGENAHVIDDGVNGLLAQPGDIGGMTSALEKLIAAPALRERMGAAARRKVIDRFTVQHMTAEYEAAYLEP